MMLVSSCLLTCTVSSASSPGAAQLVTFTLVRGGPSGAALESFVNSRQCLDKVLPDGFLYDDVAFHEGNVPYDAQQMLRSDRCARLLAHMLIFIFAVCTCRPRLRFEDVRMHDGFQNDARVHRLLDAQQGERLEYGVGYRHMVSLN